MRRGNDWFALGSGAQRPLALSAAMVALAGAACGGGLTEQEQRDVARFSEGMESRTRASQARLLNDLRAHRRALGKPPAEARAGILSYFVGSTTRSTSPFDGKSVEVLERGLLAMEFNGESRFYDGEFLYFHPNPTTMMGGAVVFLGRVETANKPDSKAFGLYVADADLSDRILGPVHLAVFYKADQEYIESFEKKQGAVVAKYKEEIAERARADAEARDAAWSFGEALVVGMGGSLLATGSAQADELIKTGLKFGVRAARDGVGSAAESVLDEQRAKLTGALMRAATRASGDLAGRGVVAVVDKAAGAAASPEAACGSAWTCGADAQAGGMCKAACVYTGARRGQTCEVLQQTFPKAKGCCSVCN